MSYSLREAKAERAIDISAARNAIDAPERLRKLADLEAKEDNMELAEALLNEANRIEMAYDEARDNEL